MVRIRVGGNSRGVSTRSSGGKSRTGGRGRGKAKAKAHSTNRERLDRYKKGARERKKRRGKGGDFVKFQEGYNYWRLLPPWSEDWGLPIIRVVKFFNLPDGSHNIICPELTWEEDGYECPILDALRTAEEELDKDLYDKHTGTATHGNALIMGEVNEDGEVVWSEEWDSRLIIPKPKIIQGPAGMFNEILEMLGDEDEPDCCDLHDGVWIRTEKVVGARWSDTEYHYKEMNRRKDAVGLAIPDDEDATDALDGELHDLDKIFKRPTDESMATAGEVAEKCLAIWRGEEEPVERRSKSAGRGSRRRRDDDEEDDRGSRRRSRRRDEDEEEDRPRRSRRRRDEEDEEKPKQRIKVRVRGR